MPLGAMVANMKDPIVGPETAGVQLGLGQIIPTPSIESMVSWWNFHRIGTMLFRGCSNKRTGDGIIIVHSDSMIL